MEVTSGPALCTSRRDARGWTIMEILVVVALIVALVGIIVPIYSFAKKSAKSSYDLNLMRQMGDAAELYREDYGKAPLSCQTLVATGRITESLVYGLSDPTDQGVAKEHLAALYDGPRMRGLGVPDYRLSFLGLGDIGMFDDASVPVGPPPTKSFPAAGWLADMTTADRDSSRTPYFEFSSLRGRYRLLRQDGGVESRPIPAVTVQVRPGHLVTCLNDAWLYTDVPLGLREDVCRTFAP